MGRRSLSSNHFSHDQQVKDVICRLPEEARMKLEAEFPEVKKITWELHGSHWNAEAMGVDVEYTMWVTDWIEANTEVYWEDGEPWEGEDEDDEE